MGVDIKKYYSEHSPRSEISDKFAAGFPANPLEIMKQVRKSLIHPCENPAYFFSSNWPWFSNMANLERELATQKIVAAKCREFAMLSAAVMRAKGIPARSRCGFATYFDAGIYEDHWVAEYYDKGAWHLADAQTLRLELAPGEFINGGIAWQLVRKYGFDPKLFGFTGNCKSLGLHYAAANMIRDLGGLVKDELEYLEENDLMCEDHKLSASELAGLDAIAELILGQDTEKMESAFAAMRPDIKLVPWAEKEYGDLWRAGKK
ncbi:MAG: transglutaminase domain-containing protein [Rickettsiales bacterium]|jgi:hypothetical protein|nr:transglutaminase domain-containing protein [Rickettsiales bacterium]